MHFGVRYLQTTWYTSTTSTERKERDSYTDTGILHTLVLMTINNDNNDVTLSVVRKCCSITYHKKHCKTYIPLSHDNSFSPRFLTRPSILKWNTDSIPTHMPILHRQPTARYICTACRPVCLAFKIKKPPVVLPNTLECYSRTPSLCSILA